MAKPPSRDDDRTRVSRRTFLKTAGVGAAASSLLNGTAEPAAATVLGPDAAPLSLKVNGAARTVTVEPRGAPSPISGEVSATVPRGSSESRRPPMMT